MFKSTRTPYWDAGALLRTNTSRHLYTTKAGARVDWNATNVTESDLALNSGETILSFNDKSQRKGFMSMRWCSFTWINKL